MKTFVAVLSSILLLFVGLVVLAQAEVAGRITQVEGRVDFLKGGKLPAAEAKLDASVEVGDVLRTKSLSRAQITFMDNTVLTVSPESRIAVEEYMVDPGKGKRSAVLQLFQGLAHVVVSKVFKASEPDFVVKTQTAVMGVRGTEVGLRIHPNNTTILNFEGHTEVGNIFPEVGDLLFKKAYKTAFSWGGPSTVHLHNMQGTSVFRGLPPTQPFTITQQDRQQFMGQMGSGLTGRRGTGGGTQTTAAGGTSGSGSSSSGGTGGGTETSGSGTSNSLTPASLGGPDSGLGSSLSSSTSSTLPTSVTNPTTTGIAGTGLTANQVITNTIISPTTNPAEITTPPPTPPLTPSPTPEPPPTPTPGNYSFTQTGYTAWQSTAAPDGQSNTMTSSGWGQRTGTTVPDSQPLPESYGGYFTSSSNGSRTLTQGALLGTGTGTSFSTLTGTVSGVLGSTLTGTGSVTGTSSYGETTNFTGTVTIDSSGRLTFTYTNGTISSLRRLVSGSGTVTDTPGNYFTQTLDGATLRTSSSPYNTASLTSLGTGGSRTGVLPGYFGLSLTGTETSPWSFSYLQPEMGDVNSTMQGVVSGTPGSTLMGAMTIFPTNQEHSFSSSLVSTLQPNSYLFPLTRINETIVSTINIQPNGSVTGAGYDTYFQDGKFTSTTFALTQTPITGVYAPTNATYNFTQTYNGALMTGNNMGPVSAGDTSVGGFGWGLRSGTGTTGGVAGGAVLNYNGYFGAYDNGVWTGAASALPSYYNGSSLTTGISGPGSVTQMSGSVSGTLGHTLTGNMTWIGSLINGPSFSYSGPVTISSDGSLQFAYGNGTYTNGSSYSSNWTFGASNGTASGTLYEYPGYRFTQTMTGNNYQLNLSNPSNGTLTVSNSTSAGGSRSGVYGGNIGPFSGTFSLWSSYPNSLPVSSMSGTGVSLTLEGVAGTSELGATSGPATLQINTTDYPALSMTVPGTVSLSPGNNGFAGGTYFTAPGVLVQNSSGTPFAVGSYTGPSTLPSPLAQTPLYYFSESYQGFRLSTLGASPNLANIEGYGFGVSGSSGTIPTGTTALPANNVSGYNYLGTFLAQDLGTRASATSLSSNMVSLGGSLTATLSGTLGRTLTGQGLFTGISSAGVAFNYQGNVSLTADGQLVFTYGGTWNSTTSGQTGTGSGMIQQIPGTSFTETVTGTYQQASTSIPLGTNYPTGTNLSVITSKDATPLTGTRTMDPGGANTTTSTTGSYAGMLATVNPPAGGPNTGPLSVTVQGVVAGASYQTQWGVATLSTTGGGSLPSGPNTGTVTIDPSGTLTGQFVNTQNSGISIANPANNLTQNYASVPTGSGLTTSSYTQTASGTFDAAANNINNNTQSVVSVTSPTLTGTSTGVLDGAINSNLAITSTALQPGAYASGSGTISTTTVGVVAGPSGGIQTGVSSVQAVKAATSGTTTPTAYVGATTLTPGVGPGASPTLTTILQGVNTPTIPGVGPVGATQTGILTVTK